MKNLVVRLTWLHRRIFGKAELLLDRWFLGLFARFVFLAVLYFHFLASAGAKVGEGFWGFFRITDQAYEQLLPSVLQTVGGNVAALAFVPWGLIVTVGTYAEFILPLLVVTGLFTRIAALCMIVFLAVQSYLDVFMRGADPEMIGAWFDRFSDGLIADQRLLWVFLLSYLVLKGPGLVSLDALFLRRVVGMRPPPSRNAGAAGARLKA